jgi:hypothetical protein
MALAKKQEPIQRGFFSRVTCVMNKMSFRKQTTYNINDTDYVKDKRHIIVNGVLRRCELVLEALAQAKRTTTSGCLYDYNIQSVLDSKFGNESYKLTDIQYAITRLQRVGLVEESKKGSFSSIPGALTRFYQLTSN